MDDEERDDDVDRNEPDPDAGSAPLSSKLGASFGTALGGAMLGLEQALRDMPPAEVIAGEHQPSRGLSGDDDGLVIVFPDEDSGDDEP